MQVLCHCRRNSPLVCVIFCRIVDTTSIDEYGFHLQWYLCLGELGAAVSSCSASRIVGTPERQGGREHSIYIPVFLSLLKVYFFLFSPAAVVFFRDRVRRGGRGDGPLTERASTHATVLLWTFYVEDGSARSNLSGQGPASNRKSVSGRCGHIGAVGHRFRR